MSRLVDLTGQRFGTLTVLRKSSVIAKSGAAWDCQCDCGRITTVTSANLKSGNTRSCGCQQRRLNEKDLAGMTFGNLQAIRKSSKRSGTNPVWECICSCGTVTAVIQENLLNGHTRSCGCLKFDLASLTTKHGMSSTRLYHVWRGMIARCEYPSHDSYPYYGGMGIKVCDEWRHDFQAFFDWAMAAGYDPEAPFGECTIDRIDVNGDYEPCNCRWVSIDVQAKNKRK